MTVKRWGKQKGRKYGSNIHEIGFKCLNQPAVIRAMVQFRRINTSWVQRDRDSEALHLAGGLIGGFFATNVGASQPLGLEGWRFSFHLMAAISLATAALIHYQASDPRPRVSTSTGSARNKACSLCC